MPNSYRAACFLRVLDSGIGGHVPPVAMSQADTIREYALTHFVGTARHEGRSTVTIRAGDVCDQMIRKKLLPSGRVPNVCNALRGNKFQELAGLRLLERTGPPEGKTAEFHYAVIDTVRRNNMTLTRQFNDSPIETPDDDIYGFAPFAKSIAKTMSSLEAPLGTTIALHGAWGSGKSSFINLLRHELNTANSASLVISEFKCWWFRGEEALALAFLQNLHAVLQKTFKDKAKDLIPKLGRGVLQAGPVIGSAIATTSLSPLSGLFNASADLAGRLFPGDDPLDQTFNSLKTLLTDEDRRFLIIIDDIDRLAPDEALAVFRIVKSFGQLPNVIYLLAFDRVFAEEAVKKRYPSEGPHFLEKIIQASFELPIPLRTDLNQAVLKSIEETCGPPPDEGRLQQVGNMFHQVVVPYLRTPRDAARFRNAITITWPAIANEINIADFIALETLRLFEPTAFLAIRTNKPSLCGLGDPGLSANNGTDDPFEPFLAGVDSKLHQVVKDALQHLFPSLEEVEYTSDFKAEWNSERRVCVETHFDTYFRLHLGDEALSIRKINSLVEKADDQQLVRSTFREAARRQRKNGTSMVPVYLDELIDHASRIKKTSVELLLAALFEIHDDIDLEIDVSRGFMPHESTTLRYHRLVRKLTEGRFTIDERTELLLSATNSACLGWLVKFAATAKNDYRERKEGHRKEKDCLVRKDAVADLTDQALVAIWKAATDDQLLHHKDLIFILYRWSEFRDVRPDEISEVRVWTDQLLDDDQALVVLAQRMMSESWSGSFGDSVAMREDSLRLVEDPKIIDIEKLIGRIKELQEAATLDHEDQKHVDKFLSALNREE